MASICRRTPSIRPPSSTRDGKPYSGANRYVLHFDKGQLPPANAFWSVTLYDKDGFQAPNALNRFALGDRDKLAVQSGWLARHPYPACLARRGQRGELAAGAGGGVQPRHAAVLAAARGSGWHLDAAAG
ncbi:MAG: DUF1214 domain-containing protein [Candidatus Kaistia colombiensis]|nr:MAG: DUF1214 domain-containing protein [Kaistia sp.]